MKEILTKEKLLQLVPEINEIQNEEWRQIVCDIYTKMYHASNYSHIEDALFRKGCDTTLLTHTRSVTKMALAIADALKEVYGLELDRDRMLVEGLLHDGSKFVEKEATDKGIVQSRVGTLYQHSFLVACEALSAGLPDDVVGDILAHGHYTMLSPTSMEGIILFYADTLELDYHLWGAGDPKLTLLLLKKGKCLSK